MIPYKVYSQFSIQNAFCHVDEIVAKADEFNLQAICLTDENSLSGAVEFLQCIEKVNKEKKKNLLGIIGCTFETEYGPVILLAKNQEGYFTLCKLVSKNYTNWPLIGLCQDTTNIVAIVSNEQAYNFCPLSSNNKFIDSSSPTDDPRYIYGPEIRYILPSDKQYQQIVICSKLKETKNNIIHNLLTLNEKDRRYFDDNIDLSFRLTDSNSDKLLPLFQKYSLGRKPKIPVISNNADEDLRNLCRKGWKKLGYQDLDPTLKQIYVDRINLELQTFADANLSNYFLIVADFAQFTRNQGFPFALRGSAVGCLTSYLIGVSDVDPIRPDPTLPYDKAKELLFSRFYSAARNTKEHTSLPDVDIDLPISFRSKLVEYVKEKYGKEHSSYIITFGRMDGKGAIKEVFRVLEPVAHAFEIANEITSNMVDTAKVQDILEDYKEDNPKYNIINYNIDHVPGIEQYYNEYREIFDIAIKMASCIRNTGIHAAGIVISSDPIESYGPVLKDGDKNILALEMTDAEYCGFVKYDFLGVAAYEKIYHIENMIKNNLCELPMETV